MNESETTTVHDLALTPPRNTVFRLEPSLETCFLYSVQFAPKKAWEADKRWGPIQCELRSL